jgi:hypothetical protein
MFEHIVLCINKIENMSCSSKVTMQTSISPAKGTFYQILFHYSISLELISFDAQRREGSRKWYIGNLKDFRFSLLLFPASLILEVASPCR